MGDIFGDAKISNTFWVLEIPNLSNGNQSLPELWRHARVHAIRCTHR